MSKAGVLVSKPGQSGPARVLPGAVSGTSGSSPSIPAASAVLSTRLGAILQQLGIPQDTPSFLALHALMGEGLGLDARSIKAVRAIVLRHTTGPGRAAVLAARAMAAGLRPDDDGIEALIRMLSGRADDEPVKTTARIAARNPGGEHENGSGKDQDQDSGRNAGKDSGRDASDQSPSESGRHGSSQHHHPGQGGQQHPAPPGPVKFECQDEQELRKHLESVFVELSSRAAADPGFSSLARRGPDGRGWLCVPYRFSVDTVDFSGYFRIVFNYATSRVERLVAEMDSSGLTRVLDVSWGPAGKPLIRFMPASPAEGGEFARVFGASMKVELVESREATELIDAFYKEVDGHA